jgi:sulfate transport system permease protein
VTLPNALGAALWRVALQRPGDGRVRRSLGRLRHVRGETNTMPLHIEILYNEYHFMAAFASLRCWRCLLW